VLSIALLLPLSIVWYRVFAVAWALCLAEGLVVSCITEAVSSACSIWLTLVCSLRWMCSLSRCSLVLVLWCCPVCYLHF
jgi:hypothetical protein